MAFSEVLSTQCGGLRRLPVHLFTITSGFAVLLGSFCRRPLHPLPGAPSEDMAAVGKASTLVCKTHQTQHKKEGNYTEETDRHEPIEFRSVSVH